MTVFEFLSVAVSIVMALTLGKLIAATPHVFARRARDPIHSGFFITNSFVVLMVWWFVWDLNAKTSWTFFEFLIMMGAPASLYLAAHILVSDIPGNIESWKEHFAGIHRWYFAAVFGTIVFAVIRVGWIHEDQLQTAIGFIVLGGVISIGFFSSRRSVHAGILVFWMLFQAFALSQRYTAVG